MPNQVIEETYGNYFLKILKDEKIVIDSEKKVKYLMELIYDGKIDTVTKYIEEILQSIDNRMFMKFDEIVNIHQSLDV